MGILPAAALIVCAAISAQAQNLWGDLQPGKYPIGFRSYFKVDHGRLDRGQLSPQQEQCLARQWETLDDPTQAQSLGDCLAKPVRNEHPSKAAGYRPVLLAIWYPASSTASRRMELRHYFEIPRLPQSPELSQRLGQFSKKALADEFRNPERSAQTSRMQTRAYKNAPTATGRFPLILYHPGAAGSYDENVILCEFLASHGYVVISSAYQTSTTYVANNFNQTPRSIRDLQFLLQVAASLPYVDMTKVAGLGHSAGAQTFMHWIGQADCPLNAMVSLDSTLEHAPKDYPGYKQEMEALESMEHKPTVPVMLFASAHNNPDFNRLDRFLEAAVRYEVTISGLTHSQYTTQGVISALSQDKGQVKQRYRQICDTVRLFLNSALKFDRTAHAALSRLVADADPSVRLRYRE